MIGKITGMEDTRSALDKGADFYMVLASLMFEKAYEDISQEERTEAKMRYWSMINSGRKVKL